MAQRSNSDKGKETKKGSRKVKSISPKNDEDFNTGSHSPSSVRKVSAGYDDTGIGNGSKTIRGTDKKVTGTQKNLKANLQKIRRVMNLSGKTHS
jgi:hypothetical protein